jgi:hypothetical protein
MTDTMTDELVTALVAKLDECQPHIDGAFQFMAMHGAEYSGPQYGVELDALRAALASTPTRKLVDEDAAWLRELAHDLGRCQAWEDRDRLERIAARLEQHPNPEAFK